MNIINKLTIQHLKMNRSRTVITILAIVLSVAMICCVAGFLASARDMGMREIKSMKGDWHVAYNAITRDVAEAIAGEAVFASYYTQDNEEAGLVNIYLRLEKPKRDALEAAEEIAGKYGVGRWSSNRELLAIEGALPDGNVMATVISIAAICIAVIVAGSVIVIANAFFISSSERVRQFGLLKSAGATSQQIKRSILFEALLLTVIAIPVGVAAGFLIQAGVLWLTNNLLVDLFALNNTKVSFRVVFDLRTILVSIVIAMATVLASAWLPARRAAGVSPIDAIRQTKDIRIRSKNLKTLGLTRRLFGFEGELAAKSLKRSRGKYRATVVSLTVSVVLFISMSSFVGAVNKGVEMEFGGYDFDVLIGSIEDVAVSDRMGEALNAIPGAQVRKMRRMVIETILPDGFITENTPTNIAEHVEEGDTSDLMLYPISDEEYAKIIPVTWESIIGVLLNTATLTADDKIKEVSPFSCSPGTVLPIMPAGWGEALSQGGSPAFSNAVITIGAVITEIPEAIPGALLDSGHIHIFIPESVFRMFFVGERKVMDTPADTMFIVSTEEDPDAFCEKAWEMLTPYLFPGEMDDFFIQNVSQYTRLNNNITTIVVLFSFGFIAMLSLIAITSVISTISTGMALRRQEFAMLYSAGMTPGGMNKMMNLESLLYGLKSLAIGLPAGVTLSYMIFQAMSLTFTFAYQLPISAMLICAAAVMLLTFGTMRYSKGKLGKIHIVEAIRSEVI